MMADTVKTYVKNIQESENDVFDSWSQDKIEPL